MAPVPAEQFVGSLGSSAPLSVDTTSTRCTLIPQNSSSKGGVLRRASMMFCASAWYCGNSEAWYPSPRMTRFQRRLLGPWSTTFVVPATCPSVAPIGCPLWLGGSVREREDGEL